jgi:hypothetical protein
MTDLSERRDDLVFLTALRVFAANTRPSATWSRVGRDVWIAYEAIAEALFGWLTLQK